MSGRVECGFITFYNDIRTIRMSIKSKDSQTLGCKRPAVEHLSQYNLSAKEFSIWSNASLVAMAEQMMQNPDVSFLMNEITLFSIVFTTMRTDY